MQEHQVEFNVLCTVNAVNCRQPLDVYRFFRDELGARYLQFIPIVEKEEEGRGAGGEGREARDEGVKITDRSVSPDRPRCRARAGSASGSSPATASARRTAF
jgi:uncharacterized protein